MRRWRRLRHRRQHRLGRRPGVRAARRQPVRVRRAEPPRQPDGAVAPEQPRLGGFLIVAAAGQLRRGGRDRLLRHRALPARDVHQQRYPRRGAVGRAGGSRREPARDRRGPGDARAGEPARQLAAPGDPRAGPAGSGRGADRGDAAARRGRRHRRVEGVHAVRRLAPRRPRRAGVPRRGAPARRQDRVRPQGAAAAGVRSGVRVACRHRRGGAAVRISASWSTTRATTRR